MITTNIKWFLGLSVAAHAAVLIAWQTPALLPGKTGHALQLSVMQHTATGGTRSQAESRPDHPVTAADAIPPAQADTPLHEAPARTAPPRQARLAPAHSQAPALPVESAVAVPTVAGTPPASPGISPQAADRHLRNSVMELLARELTYPAIARRKGWQGIVRLELHIEADGSITDLQVDESSGYRVLDQAALHCLQLASLPDAARWLQGQAVDIVVPVEYRLVDG